ncbi:MAG TPA: hypothetical protein PLO14_16395, partial [Accumulibacter sp.]|nr:hypothetical protein [Accumulibacter sp.]
MRNRDLGRSLMAAGARQRCGCAGSAFLLASGCTSLFNIFNAVVAGRSKLHAGRQLGFEARIIRTPLELLDERTMWQDAIVQETRQRREVFASQYGHDPGAIFQAILQRQSLSHRAKASYATHTP